FAYGFTENTDEGCTGTVLTGFTGCTNGVENGGGGGPFQDFRKDVETNQVAGSVMHVPTGLWAYAMYQQEHNDGTPFLTLNRNLDLVQSAANNTSVWFAKAGIKRTWTPLGATVLWGEGGQYIDEFGNGLCFGNTNPGFGNGDTGQGF